MNGTNSIKRCGFVHLWSLEKEWIPNEELKKYASNGFRREWKQL